MADIAKILAFRALTQLSLTDATRCAFFDRVVGLQWMAVLGLLTLPLQIIRGVASSIVITQMALFTSVVLGVASILITPKLLSLLRNKFIDRVAQLLVDYRVTLTPGRSAMQLVIAALNLTAAAATLYTLTLASGLSVNPWLVVAFIPLLQFINSSAFFVPRLGRS